MSKFEDEGEITVTENEIFNLGIRRKMGNFEQSLLLELAERGMPVSGDFKLELHEDYIYNTSWSPTSSTRTYKWKKKP